MSARSTARGVGRQPALATGFSGMVTWPWIVLLAIGVGVVVAAIRAARLKQHGRQFRARNQHRLILVTPEG